jgi:hypothetical protein
LRSQGGDPSLFLEGVLIKDERTGFDVLENVEVHDWEFGGGVR